MSSVQMSLSNVEAFRGYAVTWFADVATTYLINARLGAYIESYMGNLCAEAKAYATGTGCGNIRIPLTSNDRRRYMNYNGFNLFDLCQAADTVCGKGYSSQKPLPLVPALSLEFTEYVRSFMSCSKKRVNVVWVDPILHALAIIGTHISYVYKVMRGKEWEWVYVFVRVPNPKVVNYRKLHAMVTEVTRSAISNELGKLSLMVGVASAIALAYGGNLRAIKGSPLEVNFVRLTGTGNKNMLKAFEILDLGRLAYRLYRLGIASSVYDLIARCPREGKLKSFVERLSKAIVMCELLGNYSEIYSTLRALSSKDFVDELESHYGKGIVGRLLNISV